MQKSVPSVPIDNLPRVVVDTNVLVSAILQPLGNPAKILELFLDGKFIWLVNHFILAKYQQVLSREKFHLAPEQIREMMDFLLVETISVDQFSNSFLQSIDPKDTPFLECAIVGQAHYLVTGNKKHFPQSISGKTRVLSPREFLEVEV